MFNPSPYDPFADDDEQPLQPLPPVRPVAEEQIEGISIGFKQRIVAAWHAGSFTEIPVVGDPGNGEVIPLTYRHSDGEYAQRVRAWRLDEAEANVLRDGYGVTVIYVDGTWMPGKCDCRAKHFKSGLEPMQQGRYKVNSCKHPALAAYIMNKAQEVLRQFEADVKAHKRAEAKAKLNANGPHP